jgi:hypothetical protein
MNIRRTPGVKPGTKKPQQPPGQGLRHQLLEWFRMNPGKGISAVEVSRKFKVSLAYARNTLCILRAEGSIKRDAVWQLNNEA